MASTRSDLEKEKGENFEVNCQNCGSRYLVHVNDVRAKENKYTTLFGIALGTLAAVLLWRFAGVFSMLIGGFIATLIWRQQTDAVRAFNSYIVRRR